MSDEPTPVWIMLDCPVCGEQVRHHCDVAAYDEWYERTGGIVWTDEYDPNARREVQEP